MSALNDLERLDQEEATPGPWRCGTKVRRTLYRAESMGVGLLGLLDRHEDTALIVAMRNRLPALLKVARAAEAFVAEGWVVKDDELRAALDWYLGCVVDLGHADGPDFHSAFSINITHNLVPMWQEAGCYEALYESDGKTAEEVRPALEMAAEVMRDDPERFQKHDSPNGWGLYVHALPFVEKCARACREYPKAIVRVSR